MTYQPGIPTGSVPLNQDFVNVQNNFTQLNTQFNVDHVPLTSTSGTPPNGYHTDIHLVPVSTVASNPPNNQPINGVTATAGYGQLFNAEINDGINTDEALFYLSGGNKLIQLTRNLVPVQANNGYTCLPGGLILQWGQINATTSTSTTLTFSTANIAFPNNCFAIFTQSYGSGTVAADTATVDIRKSTISKLSFQWAFVSNSSQYTGFFWAAIGN